MHVSEINVYPLKSGAAIGTDRAMVGPRGLGMDRRWMVVDRDNRFVTGRELPRMTLIAAEPCGSGLRLAAPGMPTLQAGPADPPREIDVAVWKSTTRGTLLDAAASEWISWFLGAPLRLVFMEDATQRPVDPEHSRPGDLVGFADSCPVLLVSRASLDSLNARMVRPVAMHRFRPNIVVEGAGPHAEDEWTRIEIGGIAFDVAKSCGRCNFVNVDPSSGERDAAGEPLRTLATYRRRGNKVCFGQYLIPRATGLIRAGDTVRILD